MTTTRLEFRKLTARIGAEVSGAGPNLELDADGVAAVRAALNEHKALVFRDVRIDDAGQQRFARYFGELTAAHPTIPGESGAPNVLAVDSETNRPINQWHTDVTFVVSPPQLSTLRSITIPPYGGETLIANTGGAYRDLPAPLRDLADTLWAVHTNGSGYSAPSAGSGEAERERHAVYTRTVYQSVHPVVRVHPLTGERGIFIGAFVLQIVGLSVGETRDILRLLQAYVTRPENVLRWRWAPGQLILFDNRITQHYAIDNYDDLPRRLNRVTVAGDVPVSVDGKPSHAIKGDAAHYTPVPPELAAI